MKLGRWLKNILIGFDQLASAFALGDADETISSRLGKAARGDYGEKWKRRTAPLRVSVDFVFRILGDPDHCRRSIEEDEGKTSAL